MSSTDRPPRINQLQTLDEVGLFHIPVLEIHGKEVVSTGGKRYIDFCQTNYLYFDFAPLLNQRGYEWTQKWGNVPGWSRMEANASLYDRFEQRLGRFLGAQRVLTLPTITLANFSLIPGIVKQGLLLTGKSIYDVLPMVTYAAAR